MARLCTVQQLRKVLPRYAFADDLAEARKHRANTDGQDGDTPEDDAPQAPAPIPNARAHHGHRRPGLVPPRPAPPRRRRHRRTSTARARDDQYRQAVDGLPDDAPRPQLGLAHGLIALAEAALAAGQHQHPGSDRYTIYAHLELGPTGGDQVALHLGPRLPQHLMALRTCDATVRPVWEHDGTPISVGRDQRIVPPRTRRLIEHRHDGCAVPGCTRRHGLDIHHLIHWQHGGPTDTANLVALCHTHHRAHHLGHLDITGNADQPDGLTFTDRHGRTLDPTGRPHIPDRTQPLPDAARAAGIQPGTYHHPLGEPLHPDGIAFHPDLSPDPPAHQQPRDLSAA